MTILEAVEQSGWARTGTPDAIEVEIIGRYTNDYPLAAALNDNREDAFLGAADPRPGRQMERDHFQE
jgi:hypothetical protein